MISIAEFRQTVFTNVYVLEISPSRIMQKSVVWLTSASKKWDNSKGICRMGSVTIYNIAARNMTGTINYFTTDPIKALYFAILV